MATPEHAELVDAPVVGGVHVSAAGDVVIGAPTAVAIVVIDPDEEE